LKQKEWKFDPQGLEQTSTAVQPELKPVLEQQSAPGSGLEWE
jgi:hypothetical protein